MYLPQAGWLAFSLKLLLAVLVMVAVLLGVMHFLPAWAQGGMLDRCLRLGLLVVAGAGSYFAMLFVQGFRPRDFARRSLS